MQSRGLIQNFIAEAAVRKYRIVAFGTAEHTVIEAASATALSFGVSTDIDSEVGERCDVQMTEVARVLYGGNVTRGELLTADSQGRAVVAAPAQGVNNRIIGIARTSGVSGDIGFVQIVPSSLQGA